MASVVVVVVVEVVLVVEWNAAKRRGLRRLADREWAHQVWRRDPRFTDLLPAIDATVAEIASQGNKVIEDINANPDKYDAVWQQNQVDFQMTGQGGVPTMSWNGEPFFGQDRFDQFSGACARTD